MRSLHHWRSSKEAKFHPVPSHTGEKTRFQIPKKLTRNQNEKHFTDKQNDVKDEKNCEFRNIPIRSTKSEISGP